MSTDWDTPPRGDFAAYVERLTAQAARSLNTSAAAAGDNTIDDARESPQLRAHRIETTRRRGKFGTVPADAPADAAPTQRPRARAELSRRLFGALVVLLVLSNALWRQPGFVPSVVIALVGWVVLQAFAVAGNERVAALRREVERRVQEAANSR